MGLAYLLAKYSSPMITTGGSPLDLGRSNVGVRIGIGTMLMLD